MTRSTESDSDRNASIRAFGLDMFSLAAKTAIVTGGNTGLGQALSVALAAGGANIFVAGLDDDGGDTAALVAERGGQYATVRSDLTQPGEPGRVIGQCVETFGSVDILVNSAGLNMTASVEQFERPQWDAMVAVNLTAAFDLAHEASRIMIENRAGKIINIASLFSFLGGKDSPAYAATKSGLVGFTRAYCDELASYGICVNAIAPGYFATALTGRTRADPIASRRIVDHIPAGRWGDPADLMGAVVFLASEASNYVNGQVLTVDGGYLVR